MEKYDRAVAEFTSADFEAWLALVATDSDAPPLTP
jgi:hypothetical protein